MSEAIPAFVEVTDAVLYQKIQDEVVLLNMDNQQYYGLNSVGADMWECLMDLRSVAAAAERICKTYEADDAAVRDDFNLLVRELIDAGLLKSAA